MFKNTRNLVRFVAALSLVAAFAALPSAADAGNFPNKKFQNHGKFQHKNHFHFHHHHHNFKSQGFHGHRFHQHQFHKPFVVAPTFGKVVAVPYGNGFVFVVK